VHSEDRRRGDTIAEWFPFKPCALVSFAYQLDTQVTEITQFILGQTLSIQRARLTHTVAQRLLVLSFFLPNKANLIPAAKPGCVDPPKRLPRAGLLRNTPVAYCCRIGRCEVSAGIGIRDPRRRPECCGSPYGPSTSNWVSADRASHPRRSSRPASPTGKALRAARKPTPRRRPILRVRRRPARPPPLRRGSRSTVLFPNHRNPEPSFYSGFWS
jgi:hypothetical protein